jgi:hypothetical protein
MIGIAQSVQRRARGWTAGVKISVGAGVSLYFTTSRTTVKAYPASCPMDTEGNAAEK